MASDRSLTVQEKRWCTRLKRVLNARPESLEIYVGLGDVSILDEGEHNRDFYEHGHSDNLSSKALYSIRTPITGDASGL